MFNKKVLAIAIAAGLTVGAASASADDAISANVALTTDYKFRGISQSDESIALQGGFDYAHESGFYVGTWGSTVDFDTDGSGYDGSLELDVYAGFGGSISEDVGYDVGVLYYDYPGDDDEEGDYLEVYGSLSFKDLTVGAAYSDDYYAETGEFWYLYADYSFALPNDFAVDLHVGLNSLDEADRFLSDGADGYTDYSVGITKSLAGVDWTLAYVGTDLNEEEVFDTEWGEGTVVFTMAKSF